MISNQRYLKDHKQFQLLVVGAMYLAIKLTKPSISLSGSTLAAITGNIYSAQEIESMEAILQQGLEWRVNGPTSVQMAEHVRALLMPHVDIDKSSWAVLKDEVHFHCECAVRDYHLSTMKRGSSTVAYAAVLNAFERIDSEASQSDVVDLLIDVDKSFASQRDEISASMERLKYLVRHIESSQVVIHE